MSSHTDPQMGNSSLSGSDNLTAGITLAQDVFSAALTNPELARPEGLLGRDGMEAGKRFDVYRNNVIVSLMDALGEAYPAFKMTIGEANFAQIARLYVDQHPPKSPMMIEFGNQLPLFLESAIKLEGAEHAIDLAKLERQWLASYHSEDVDALGPDIFEGLAEAEIEQLVFATQPATALFQTDPVALSAWQASTEQTGREEIGVVGAGSNENELTHCLIVRPQLSVKLYALAGGAAVFIGAMIEGKTFAEAAQLAVEREAEFNIGAGLGFALESGAFRAQDK